MSRFPTDQVGRFGESPDTVCTKWGPGGALYQPSQRPGLLRKAPSRGWKGLGLQGRRLFGSL